MMAANDFNINPPWFRMYQPEPEQNLNDHRDHPGVKNMPARNSPPIAYFYMMFSLNILRKITKETNRYLIEIDLCYKYFKSLGYSLQY